MASKLLPQGFVLVTCGNNVAPQFPPIKKQLGFELNSFRRLSLSNHKVSSIFSVASRSSGVVRCEGGGSDGGAEVVEEVPEDSTSEAVEAVAWKPRVKLGDVMGILNKKAVDSAEEQRVIPDIRTGDIIQIKLAIPENKRRLSVYKGIVISRQNAGIHTTIRVRRIIAGVGVEIVFPLYSPNIKEIKVVAHRKVRKARLYYLRDKLPRLSTFK
ncbi:large ribosomal subunit protein bL19c [Silene latifolia]|uniref:large ribosomal subunit protein bL19c n=1 Tax=Silene latifolia TaxID=37657 RepID=UPI003D778654